MTVGAAPTTLGRPALAPRTRLRNLSASATMLVPAANAAPAPVRVREMGVRSPASSQSARRRRRRWRCARRDPHGTCARRRTRGGSVRLEAGSPGHLHGQGTAAAAHQGALRPCRVGIPAGRHAVDGAPRNRHRRASRRLSRCRHRRPGASQRGTAQPEQPPASPHSSVAHGADTVVAAFFGRSTARSMAAPTGTRRRYAAPAAAAPAGALAVDAVRSLAGSSGDDFCRSRGPGCRRHQPVPPADGPARALTSSEPSPPPPPPPGTPSPPPSAALAGAAAVLGRHHGALGTRQRPARPARPRRRSRSPERLERQLAGDPVRALP